MLKKAKTIKRKWKPMMHVRMMKIQMKTMKKWTNFMNAFFVNRSSVKKLTGGAHI